MFCWIASHQGDTGSCGELPSPPWSWVDELPASVEVMAETEDRVTHSIFTITRDTIWKWWISRKVTSSANSLSCSSFSNHWRKCELMSWAFLVSVNATLCVNSGEIL